jgi:hypothetical protein
MAKGHGCPGRSIKTRKVNTFFVSYALSVLMRFHCSPKVLTETATTAVDQARSLVRGMGRAKRTLGCHIFPPLFRYRKFE